jgi:hypothetical protein
MKQERVILSFIMVLIGLAFAGIIFYFYQSSKVIPDSKDKTTQGLSPTPTLAPTLFLTLDDPRDESIADKKTIRVAGKTNPEATVIVFLSAIDSSLGSSRVKNKVGASVGVGERPWVVLSLLSGITFED